MYGDRVDADTDEMTVLAKVELDEFLAGERETFDPPGRTQGTSFRSEGGLCCARSPTARPQPTVHSRNV